MRVPWPREAAAQGVSVEARGQRRGHRGTEEGDSVAAVRPVGLPGLRGFRRGVGEWVGGYYRGANSSGKGWGLGRHEGRGRQHMLGGLGQPPKSPARGGRRARFEKARKFSSFPRLPPPPPIPFQAPGKAQNPEL